MNKPSLLPLALAIFTASLSTSTLAANCSRDEIDHFLDRGFTPEQVVQLCGNTAPVVSAPVAPVVTAPAAIQSSAPAPAAVAPSTPTKAAGIPAGLTDEEWYTVKNAIDADTVTLEGNTLVYERDRCHEFGTEGFTGFKEEACVNTRTRIGLNGLMVTSAKDGIFLILASELIVKANIAREVLNGEKVRAPVLKGFLKEFPLTPRSIEVPIKNGFKPTEIGPLLTKLAR